MIFLIPLVIFYILQIFHRMMCVCLNLFGLGVTQGKERVLEVELKDGG